MSGKTEGGGIAPPLHMLSKGERLRKGGGGIAPNWPCWDAKNPIARNRDPESTLLFQPQTVTRHKEHTLIKHLARGRLWVDSWSIFGQIWSKWLKLTKIRPKTDRKPTQNWPSPGSRQASTPKKGGGSVAEIKVLNPEPQNSQSDYFYCLTLSGRLFFPPFNLMKLAWWSWASGYQTNLSLCFVGKLLPD